MPKFQSIKAFTLCFSVGLLLLASLNACGKSSQSLLVPNMALEDPEGKMGRGKPKEQKIIYAARIDNEEAIYAMNLDGTGIRKLVSNLSRYVSPVVSSNGDLIAFAQGQGFGKSIYVMTPEGKNKRQVTERGSNIFPAWSPDGKQVAFLTFSYSKEPQNDYDLNIVNTDGANLHSIATNIAHSSSIDWSPDGSKIVFVSRRDGNKEIYTINIENSELKRVTNNNVPDDFPKWSPDGTKIVFSSFREYSSSIYVIDSDGRNTKRITPSGIQGRFGDVCPSWSADGKKMVFLSDRDKKPGSLNVYVINVDGSGLKRLTNYELCFIGWPSFVYLGESSSG